MYIRLYKEGSSPAASTPYRALLEDRVRELRPLTLGLGQGQKRWLVPRWVRDPRLRCVRWGQCPPHTDVREAKVLFKLSRLWPTSPRCQVPLLGSGEAKAPHIALQQGFLCKRYELSLQWKCLYIMKVLWGASRSRGINMELILNIDLEYSVAIFWPPPYRYVFCHRVLPVCLPCIYMFLKCPDPSEGSCLTHTFCLTHTMIMASKHNLKFAMISQVHRVSFTREWGKRKLTPSENVPIYRW